MAEFVSKGVAGTGLGLSIARTVPFDGTQTTAEIAANQAVINQKGTDNLTFADSNIDNTKQEILYYCNTTLSSASSSYLLDSICLTAQLATMPIAS